MLINKIHFRNENTGTALVQQPSPYTDTQTFNLRAHLKTLTNEEIWKGRYASEAAINGPCTVVIDNALINNKYVLNKFHYHFYLWNMSQFITLGIEHHNTVHILHEKRYRQVVWTASMLYDTHFYIKTKRLCINV